MKLHHFDFGLPNGIVKYPLYARNFENVMIPFSLARSVHQRLYNSPNANCRICNQ